MYKMIVAKIWESVTGSDQIEKLEGSLLLLWKFFYMKSHTTAVVLKLPNPCKLSISKPAVCYWGDSEECMEMYEDIRGGPSHNEHETSKTPRVPIEIISTLFWADTSFVFLTIKKAT